MDAPHAVVTGGAGFIGSHLCEALLADGWRVTAVDNLSTGRRSNLQPLAGHAAFRFVEADVEAPGTLDDACAGARIVYHLAAVVGVQKVLDDPVGTVEGNHAATRAVLRAARDRGARVLLASSSEVYGANPNPSFREDDPCIIGPTAQRRWCYSASKLMDEFHAYAYHYAHGLETVVVRLFNTIGPRQVGRYGMVVPRFVRQALAGEPLTVYGDGTQARCFTWVGDVVRCLQALAAAPDADGGVFNIGNDQEVTIQALAEAVLRMTGSASPIAHIPYEEAYGARFKDVPRRRPDPARLRDTVGFAPETPLESALAAIIAEHRAEASS